MELILILIHVIALGLLAFIGILGAYITQPVFPIKEALRNWTEGLIAWSIYWSLIIWQVTIPLTYGLWFNGKIFGLKDIWATIVWALIFGFIAGIVMGVRYHRAYKAVSFWAFLAGFVLTFLFMLLLDGVVYLLVGEFYNEMFAIGSLEYLNLSSPTDVVGLVLIILYPIVAYLAARKMQIFLAIQRKIIIKK